MTIIDSCVIIDVINKDAYREPSLAAITERGRKGRIFAPDIVFSEVCLSYDNVNDAKEIFRELDIKIVHLNEETLYLAAASFQNALKRRKSNNLGSDKSIKRILPDFYIGALASMQGIPLLTRDNRNWRADFPTLQVISP